MNFDLSSIESGNNIIQWLIDVVKLIFDMFQSIAEALFTFYDMLKDFNANLTQLSTDPAFGSGLPVIQAIGVVRYLVGDVIFYFLYMVILFGCLATILRLVLLLVEAYDAMIEQIKGKSGSTGVIAKLLSKFQS